MPAPNFVVGDNVNITSNHCRGNVKAVRGEGDGREAQVSYTQDGASRTDWFKFTDLTNA